ncbi:MAG: hypothetical protein FRX48_06827 [Lasallia pustulata]|uniref:Uncharacterized protein n=1 Tax=Lasallia pustulata TaxID=136370 RepID=A0A5M8PL04_9LECA|nr:MAG: hypothetical protein FRX48_06827 [Lasallia pustulata]
MAEQSPRDVVNQAQSVGDPAPTDVSANTTTDSATSAAAAATPAPTKTETSSDSTPRDSTAVEENSGSVNSGVESSTTPEGLAHEIDADGDTTASATSPKVNGVNYTSENPELDPTEDGTAQNAGLDSSVGSDTDTSKAEAADLIGKDNADGKHHVRSGSAKKPTTFKAVSVTKNFLAKAGTGSTTASKAGGDKVALNAAASTKDQAQPAPRPRLVAKTASGQRASAPKPTNTAYKNGRGSGPDPLQVWNRNRPVAPTAQKHFTDEELKQQYGIHLATRLQADGDRKEAWADIDDDEDDWAPDTIEWNDGTKITLPHTDNSAALAEEQAAASAAKLAQEEAVKAEVPVPKLTSTIGPNATVLKVGSVGQPRAGGLVLKTPSDKPTLVAKPSAPTPVKSPWAPLPPVEKTAPVSIIPQQQSISRFQQSDPHGFESMPPQPSSAKEIAADDFTRSWRDTQTPHQRELFNSQSGRYEPVKEARRGSIRNDQNFRAPSLLQRPSPGEQHGPAEPSAAFQTSRSGSQQEGSPWARRRTSSNVSGESGAPGRRISMSRGTDLPSIPSEVLQQRRESQREHSPYGHAQLQGRPGLRESSPAQQRQQQPPPSSPALTDSQPAASPQLAKIGTVLPQTVPAMMPGANQDAVNLQKQIMREKRETAMKRKKEEEEREETEKAERIRLKLEQLGLAPLPQKKEASKEAPALNSQPATVISHPAQSPPKPPVPDTSGAPIQYGVMKVHGSQLATGTQPATGSVAEEAAKPRSSSHDLEQGENDAQQPPLTNGVIKKDSHDEIPAQGPLHTSDQGPMQDHRLQPWKNVQSGPDSYTSWGAAAMTTHSSPGTNLWGHPGHIGNGDIRNPHFDRNVSRPTSRQTPYQQHMAPPAPQPIGPPRNIQRPLGPTEVSQGSISLQRSLKEDSQTAATFSTPVSPSMASKTPSLVMNRTDRNSNAESAGPSSSGTLPMTSVGHVRHSQAPETQMSKVSAWNNFAASSAKEESEKNNKTSQEQTDRLSEEALPQAVLNETWRQVRVDDQAVQRQVVGVSKTRDAQSNPVGSQANGDTRNSAFASPMQFPPMNAALPTAIGPPRGSRFFPNPGHIGQAQNQRATSYTMSYTMGSRRLASPPPPDSDDHPVFTGASGHPLVNLPLPKPKVKLPPTAAIAVQPLLPLDPPVVSVRAVSQPLVKNPFWQARINGLLASRPSPDRKAQPQVEPSTTKQPQIEFSTTKLPFDVAPVRNTAAVSLPPKDPVEYDADGGDVGDVTAKIVEDEEALFEEREFGSLPAVRIPASAPSALWQPAKLPKNNRLWSRISKETELVSAEPFTFTLSIKDRDPCKVQILIRMPGMAHSRWKIMARANAQGLLRDHQTQRNTSLNNKARKPLPSRESSSNYAPSRPSQAGQQTAPVRPAVQISTSQQARPSFGPNNSAWARRVPGAVQ